MAHESFEDIETARVMNELFVNIKVDREERPDVDQIYMNALHLLGEQGGWPLTMFLTPEGEPFWGGTYFPKESRYGRPSFTDVLYSIAQTYREQPDKIAHNCRAIVEHLNHRTRSAAAPALSAQSLDREAETILGAIDPLHGGLQVAPKFPQCEMLAFLWRAGMRSKRQDYFDAVALSLTKMSHGGIYDHLGGGYARYSVDEKWLVPHFEKMLYDNAQIVDLLALDSARAADPLYRMRAEETIGWLAREMTTPEGAFASSLDADSEGEEGRFYVWSLAEVEEVLGPQDAILFASQYDVSRHGNFEGHNILNRLRAPAASAPAPKALAAMRERLFARRALRVRPGLDDKVLADWNGLMIAALAHASTVFDVPRWLDMAVRAFDFIAVNMASGGRLGHSWRAGKLQLPGLASDLAAMTRAALALFEITDDPRFLDHAARWQQDLEAHYADYEHGGYFLTAADVTELIVRPHATTDDAIPNHNGLIAENLVRLAAFTGSDKWHARVQNLFDHLLPVAAGNMFGHLSLLNALDLKLSGAEIVVTGTDQRTAELTAAALRLPFAVRIVIRAAHESRLPSTHPAHAMMAAAGERSAAFVCRGQSCQPPVDTAEALAAALMR
jgi:uncharacterized protein YyaL (SSP411 family)